MQIVDGIVTTVPMPTSALDRSYQGRRKEETVTGGQSLLLYALSQDVTSQQLPADYMDNYRQNGRVLHSAKLGGEARRTLQSALAGTDCHE